MVFQLFIWKQQKLRIQFKNQTEMKGIIIVLVALVLQSNASGCLGQGQVPNANNVCIKPFFIEGCLQYANGNKCAKCEFLYVRTSAGKCGLKPLDEVKECCKRKSEGRCAECKDGLLLSASGKCQELSIDGCIQKDYHTGDCKVCASQFNLLNGICQRAVTNCAQYTIPGDMTECSACAPDYSLISNTCVKNTILGCQTEDDGVCRRCYQPFDLIDTGKCIIQNCKGYNDFGCVACECGFFITQNNICKPVREGCVRYVRGNCIDCLPSWRLRGNDCVLPGCKSGHSENGICKSCRQGYDLTEQGRCQFSNCAIEGDDFCYECKTGFTQRQGRCVEQASNRGNIRTASTSR